MIPTRRLKCVNVSRELIEIFLTTGHKAGAVTIIEGIPTGARLVGVAEEPNRWLDGKPDLELVSVRLVFEHESFPEVPLHMVPDFIDVRVQEVRS